jgi:hypothetical protein
MNTAKILDFVPQTAAQASAPPAPPARETRAVPPVGSDANAGFVQQQAERRAPAPERQQAAATVAKPQLDREVGYANDGFAVVVDLVNPKAKNYRVRIFGPTDNAPSPPTPPASPASAHAAYSAGTAPAPTVKADV